MSKKRWFIIGFSLLVSLGIVFVFLTQRSDAPGTTPTNTNTSNSSSGNQSLAAENTGTYEDYSADALANASGQRVLFFHASWCPQCRAIEADIKSMGVPSGYTILKVDYDSNQDLRQKYGISLQTTFVMVDNQGNKSGENYVAYNEPTLEALKRDFLVP